MKIKIISATQGFIPELVWYAQHIGKEYEVNIKVGQNYYVNKGGEYPVGAVHEFDCEVLKS